MTLPCRNAIFEVVQSNEFKPGSPVVCDQISRMTGKTPVAIGLKPLRQFIYRDPNFDMESTFYANAFHLAAQTIAVEVDQTDCPFVPQRRR